MDLNRPPKQVFYGELTEGQCMVGGQQKRLKDNVKSTLKKFNIQPNSLVDPSVD